MENITLKKISEVLGISISTVSRALKNHPDISAATKTKVRDLADSLDYEPNSTAINLRTRNSKILGILIPSASNSFYGSFISAMEEECQKLGYAVIIMQSADNPETEKNILRLFRQNRVTGVFACLTPESNNFEPFNKLSENNIPVIFFDKVSDDHPHKVCINDKEAAELAANELIINDKKKVLAIFGNKSISITKEREKAFSASFENYPKVQLDLKYASSTEEAFEITDKIFSGAKKPDALFCMSDEILIGSMRAIQHLGIVYPQTTGIISISDGKFPKLYYPEITHVETSGSKLGKLALDYMMCLINGEEFNKKNYVKSILIQGKSL